MLSSVTDPLVNADRDAEPFRPLQQEKKLDAGKVRMDLLFDDMPLALLEVAKVLTFAVEVKGYTARSWRDVDPFNSRYNAALYRHLNAIAQGQEKDEESGLSHRAHAACCILFQLQKELE